MTIIEIWKDIEGYQGLYRVSNLGRIKSLKRNKPCRKQMILRKSRDYLGYESIMLFNDTNRSRVRVHRLVAIAFIPNPENKKQVNHLDGKKDNNCVDNLEWATASENQIHAIANGLATPTRGSGHWNSTICESDVLAIRERLKNGEKTANIARDIGITKNIVKSIKQGKTWRHI